MLDICVCAAKWRGLLDVFYAERVKEEVNLHICMHVQHIQIQASDGSAL